MALFVDLAISSPPSTPPPQDASATATPPSDYDTENPNRQNLLSALLAVYPFLAGLAACLDHNDLYNLSSACRQFHANLAGCRRVLLSLSLRCKNDQKPTEEVSAVTEAPRHWQAFRGYRRCARDLVDKCRGCSAPICRNCTYKPNTMNLFARHRRLCRPCQSSPTVLPSDQSAYAVAAFGPGVCNCAEAAWLCPSCVKDIFAQDQKYRLACELWVGKYPLSSTHPCPRKHAAYEGPICCPRGRENCCGLTKKNQIPQHVYSEDDASEMQARDAKALHAVEDYYLSRRTTTDIKYALRRERNERKSKRSGRVVEWNTKAKCVFDEEIKGECRSWCNWCDRVVPSKADKEQAEIE